jgi:hypothetical protein
MSLPGREEVAPMPRRLLPATVPSAVVRRTGGWGKRVEFAPIRPGEGFRRVDLGATRSRFWALG